MDCGKCYKDSASFKRHRLGHTGERPYPCDLCDETFIDSKAVRRHREVAHPNDPPSKSDDLEEEVDDDEDVVTPSTSAYSSFESKEEEIEVEKEMEEDDDGEEEEEETWFKMRLWYTYKADWFLLEEETTMTMGIKNLL